MALSCHKHVTPRALYDQEESSLSTEKNGGERR